MKKKKYRKNISLAVIRAVSRLNNHAHQKTSHPSVLNKKSIAKYLGKDDYTVRGSFEPGNIKPPNKSYGAR